MPHGFNHAPDNAIVFGLHHDYLFFFDGCPDWQQRLPRLVAYFDQLNFVPRDLQIEDRVFGPGAGIDVPDAVNLTIFKRMSVAACHRFETMLLCIPDCVCSDVRPEHVIETVEPLRI
jgi:hypothetical protein